MRTIVTRIASALLFASLFLAVATPDANAIPITGLLGHYRLDETSGLSASDSAGSADGTLVNFAGNEWTAGQIDNALPFVRASSQYVTINGLAGSLATGNDYTVTAWFNTTTAGLGNNQHQIFSAHDAGGGNIFRLGTDLDGGIFLATVSGDEAIGSGYNNGSWHLTTVSRTAGSTTVTVDGTVLPGFTSGDPVWTSATQFSLGQEYDGGTPGDFFDGLLDDVTVWNRALSLSEVQEIFDNGVGGFSIEGAPVPEPSACLLLVLGLPLLVRRAKRVKS